MIEAWRRRLAKIRQPYGTRSSESEHDSNSSTGMDCNAHSISQRVDAKASTWKERYRRPVGSEMRQKAPRGSVSGVLSTKFERMCKFRGARWKMVRSSWVVWFMFSIEDGEYYVQVQNRPHVRIIRVLV